MALSNPSKPYSIAQRFLNGLSGKESSAVKWALAHFRSKNPNLAPRAAVALADAAAPITSAQIFESGLFTITPTAGRAITTPTAAALIAYMYPNGYGSDDGTAGAVHTQFTIVALAAFAVTLTAGDGSVSIVGSAVANNSSATWKVIADSATTVKIYRL